MKKALLTLSLCLLTIVSCTDNEKEATEVAENFIKSYFISDYEEALNFCNEELAEHINKINSRFSKLTEIVQEKLDSEASKLETKIKEITFDPDNKKKCQIKYELTIPKFLNATEKVIELEKVEGEWKVTKVN